MVVDTSALIAILFDEPEADRFGHTLAAAPLRLLPAVTRFELSFVIEGRKRDAGRRQILQKIVCLRLRPALFLR